MTQLRKRLDRLEAQRGGDAVAGPTVIFLCDCETGEPVAAILRGGGGLTREGGETSEAFTARAKAGKADTVFLPNNGREALATGKAPDWAGGVLVEKALREKHRKNRSQK